MKVVYGGAEVGSNRTLLESMGVQRMGFSYWGARKRGLPKTKKHVLTDYFTDESVAIYVDSGATQADQAGLTQAELLEYAADYQDWLADNIEHIAYFTEFDSRALGAGWVDAQRDLWEDDSRFIPVWHHEEGPVALHDLASQFHNVAIPGEAIEADTALASRVLSLRRQYGTEFHGLACAKPDNLRQVSLTTASTLSWLSPMRRGETIIWDGSRLVRYPAKMKDQARPRYKSLLEREGLDAEKFLADDPVTSAKVAVWSYQRLEESMDKKRPDHPFTVIPGGGEGLVSDNSETPLMSGMMDLPGVPSDNRSVDVRHEKPAVTARPEAEMMPLPVFGYDLKEVIDYDETGAQRLREVPVVQSSSVSMRQCNTCFVAANCPAYKANNSCAFHLPVEVKTKEQLRGLINAIIEMQGMRVAFARYAEEVNGGYPDPNTGQEIDRLFKLLKTVKDLDSTTERISITAERQGSGGVLSAIFGDRAQTLRELPGGGLDEEATTRIIEGSIEE